MRHRTWFLKGQFKKGKCEHERELCVHCKSDCVEEIKLEVLWLCNIVLPDFSQEFGIKKNLAGGWMTGMLHELEKDRDLKISLCFPIYDSERKKDGICKGHEYYTFLCNDIEKYDVEMVYVFERILEKSEPEIVHIWGTEYPHTMAMMIACKNKGILDKTVIHIQGLVSACAKRYMADIPEDYQTLETEKHISVKAAQESLERRGIYEIQSLKMAKHVIGRTDWDQACVKAINPQVQYYFCDEILRKTFYEYIGKWDYEHCQKHTIFVSQASYPIKGFHYLLNALAIVVSQYPDTQVFVAGKNILDMEQIDSYGLYIRNLIEKQGLQEKVSFLGKLEENQMVEQYLKANVHVSASTIENSSNSLAEAMLLGVPSVASYVGGACNRIVFGEDGYLYPYNEPTLLAFYICKFFENSDGLCDRISSNSSAKIQKIVNPKMNVCRNLAIYKEIAEAEKVETHLY